MLAVNYFHPNPPLWNHRSLTLHIQPSFKAFTSFIYAYWHEGIIKKTATTLIPPPPPSFSFRERIHFKRVTYEHFFTYSCLKCIALIDMSEFLEIWIILIMLVWIRYFCVIQIYVFLQCHAVYLLCFVCLPMFWSLHVLYVCMYCMFVCLCAVANACFRILTQEW